MNHNEEVPDFLGEFLRPDGSKRPEVERGDMLPARNTTKAATFVPGSTLLPITSAKTITATN